MKRCPQCEFIYEDDQSLCDMDGILLVLDSRTLPNHHALTTLATVPAKAQQRRNRAVPAFATLILALVLGLVYYVSTQRNAASNAYPAASATSTSNPAPESIPTPQPPPSEATQPPATQEPKSATPRQTTVAPVKKPAVKTASSPAIKASSETKKEDSKVGSILKKTGRILKKPFKF